MNDAAEDPRRDPDDNRHLTTARTQYAFCRTPTSALCNSMPSCSRVARRDPARCARLRCDRHDMHVPAADIAPNIEARQQRLELHASAFRHADEEQDAAAVAGAAPGEEDQSLVTALPAQITPQDGFAIHDTAADRADPNDLGRRCTVLRERRRVAEARDVRLESPPKVRAWQLRRHTDAQRSGGGVALRCVIGAAGQE